MEKCLFQPCDSPEGWLSKGYCGKHYKRFIRHGNPSIVMTGYKFQKGHKVNHPLFIKHSHTSGGVKSGTYHSWQSMKTRCGNPNSSNYAGYGGRGISYCQRWEIFENFLNDMGERPVQTSLDRIDSKGNYEPENCRWASYKIQARNSGRKSIS